jgi:C1A family cysteine protease
LIALSFAFISCQEPEPQGFFNAEIYHKILDSFIAKGDAKQTFKVWHYIFRGNQYSLNSEIGINKYRKFKENLSLIKQHNAKNLSWQEGLNQFSDMTEAEAFEFLGVREKTKEEMNEMISKATGKKLDFDSYEDDEVRSSPKERVPVDWTAFLPPIRNQASCGSCYAFSTQAAIEGNYVKKRREEGKMIAETILLSTQQIVDCNTTTKGCSGGWMGNAIDFLFKGGIALDKDYTYTARVGTCKYTPSMASAVKVTGYETAGSYYSPKEEDVYNLLQKGPLTNCVDTNGLLRYRSGIANLPCKQVCPHAVNTIAWGKDEATGLNYIKMRNSWGTSWGEAGHARIVQNWANGFSCMLEFPGWTLRPKVN